MAGDRKRRTGARGRGVAALIEPSPAASDPFPRSPLGATDAGARDIPPKPCSRRVGSWWCTRTDQHDESGCTAPAERGLPVSTFDKGRSR